MAPGATVKRWVMLFDPCVLVDAKPVHYSVTHTVLKRQYFMGMCLASGFISAVLQYVKQPTLTGASR